MPTVHLVDVCKTYHLDSVAVPALAGISAAIQPDCFTVLAGPSGSGKTTLLNLIGGLDRADSGRIEIAGQALDALDDDALSDFRARHIGFVFQHFNLLSSRTAADNIALPLEIAGWSRAEIAARVEELLELVGIADKYDRYPSELSGGQKQRIGIADRKSVV